MSEQTFPPAILVLKDDASEFNYETRGILPKGVDLYLMEDKDSEEGKRMPSDFLWRS